jgi:hypothetical protein
MSGTVRYCFVTHTIQSSTVCDKVYYTVLILEKPLQKHLGSGSVFLKAFDTTLRALKVL